MDFLFKKPGDCRLSRNILKSQKIFGIQAILPLFESVSSSIDDFWGASDLVSTYCWHLHSHIHMLLGGDLRNMELLQKILQVF